MNQIKLVRIYDHEQPEGYRILVDRLWPRGMSKVKANLDDWAKNIAPSKELRQWFDHDEEKFPEFKKRYQEELKSNPDFVSFLDVVKEKLAAENVLFLYGAKDRLDNQAVVLKEFVEKRL